MNPPPCFRVVVCLLFASAVSAFAQNEPTPEHRESLVVTGVFQPVPLEEADRSIRRFPVTQYRLLTNSFADFLKLDSSLDLRQRAPNGVQGDLSIRGSSFGQTIVLLDGIRLNDVQSGHHNLDLPVPADAIEAVEVLHGSGSTLYGSDAVGGVVQFITRRPEASEAELRFGFGNWGTQQQSLSAALVHGNLAEAIYASRDFSTGFIPNRDYRNLTLSSRTLLDTALGTSSLLLASTDRPFGAEQFYGDYHSWERTRTWFAALRQPVGSRTEAAFAYRRHTDLFVLQRDNPSLFTNRHAVEGYQASLRRREDLGANTRAFYGAEMYQDSIASNNLGYHDRARGAVYGALDWRALHRFSLNAGVRDEVYGSFNHQVSPSVSGGYWFTPALKLRASASRAFRLPTYTDLYYHDPRNLGSPDLRPEKAWSYETGIDLRTGERVSHSVTFFVRRERDGIDYVRRSASDIWRATNFSRLNFTGIEASSTVRVNSSQRITADYTWLNGSQDLLRGVESKYVFNYPRHSGIVSWYGIAGPIMARARLGVLARLARDPYALVDLYAARRAGRVRPFLQLTNLSGSTYQEIPGVDMPGRAVLGGVSVTLKP